MTYGLRLGGAGLAVATVLLLYLGSPAGAIPRGDQLFFALNRALFVSIWLIGPVLAVDCISREKREGTLGLLFLTQLTPWGIVIGKGTVHLVRGFGFLLAIVPVLILPLLSGGVSRADLGLALSIDLAALAWSFSAGMVASAYNRDWVRALLLGEALSLAFAAGFTCSYAVALEWVQLNFAATSRWPVFWMPNRMGAWHAIWLDHFWRAPLPELIPFVLAISTGGSGARTDLACWSMIWSTWPVTAQRAWIQATALISGFSLLAIPASLSLAALQIKWSWRDQPLSLQRIWLLDRFCTPRLWRSVFRSRMTRKLDRNPIGWLQVASWQARLIRWGWCLLVLVLESVWFTDGNLTSVWAGQYWLGYLLLLSLTFAASNSFRAEQESGAIELLLVTPLRERQIILGRLFGLWNQFLPATLVLAGAWGFLLQHAALYSTLHYYDTVFGNSEFLPVFLIPTFFLLPIVGLYFSMRMSIYTSL
jgi:ABC-type transport system involved in multi-copper enzyme maturation permease subunit